LRGAAALTRRSGHFAWRAVEVGRPRSTRPWARSIP